MAARAVTDPPCGLPRGNFTPSRPRRAWRAASVASDADRANFESRRESGRFFFDDRISSCTKLIASISKERFGVSSPDLDELVTWADRIDAARFESAAQAVDRSDPVMRLVSVVEHYGDDAFLERFVPELLKRPLGEVARSPEMLWPARVRPLNAKVVIYFTAWGRSGPPGRPRPAPATTPTPRLIRSCSSSRFDDALRAVSSVICFR